MAEGLQKPAKHASEYSVAFRSEGNGACLYSNSQRSNSINAGSGRFTLGIAGNDGITQVCKEHSANVGQLSF